MYSLIDIDIEIEKIYRALKLLKCTYRDGGKSTLAADLVRGTIVLTLYKP